jgi:hypothetical protein
MKQILFKIRNYMAAMIMLASVGGGAMVVASPQTAYAADPVTCTTSGNRAFLGFPHWYRGLSESKTNCDLIGPADYAGGLSAFIWTVVLNIIEIGMVLAAWITVGMMLVGGYSFITSAGVPDKRAQAQKTISNAAIGLVISIAAIGLVNFVFGFVL